MESKFETKFDEATATTSLGYHLTKQVLAEAKAISEFCGKKKVDKSDVEFAINALREKYESNHPPRELMTELATRKNSQPLPAMKPYGLRLPNDRFCQVQPNYAFSHPPEMTVANGSAGAAPSIANTVPRVNNGVGYAATQPSVGTLNPETVSNLLTDRQGDMEEDYD